MDLKKIKELMTLMERKEIKCLSLKDGSFELQLEREGTSLPPAPPAYAPVHHPQPSHHDIPPSLSPLAAHEEERVAPGKHVTSPMVGTFYSSPSPDDPLFVKVGDTVAEDTVVCIVEAMKVMNEVKAGVSGTMAEMLVESGHPVEFGTKLFRIT